MIKNDQIDEVVDLLNHRRVQSILYSTEHRIDVARVIIENRKAAAMERIADALTAIASK